MHLTGTLAYAQSLKSVSVKRTTRKDNNASARSHYGHYRLTKSISRGRQVFFRLLPGGTFRFDKFYTIDRMPRQIVNDSPVAPALLAPGPINTSKTEQRRYSVFRREEHRRQ